jgi:DNA-binding CsgD family transcriptional regulator
MAQKVSDESIYQLWDELADFGAHLTDDALRYCMRRVCHWIGGDNAFWVGTVRVVSGTQACKDPMLGWRIAAIRMLDPAHDSLRRVTDGVRDTHSNDPGDTSRSLMADAGNFRLYGLHQGDLVDLEAFQKTEHYQQFYRQLGVTDRIWVAFPVNDDTECYFCFDSTVEGHRFSPRDFQLVAQVLRGIKWLHQQALLSHGLHAGDNALTNGERRVLNELLLGLAEKEIADRLQLTQGTVHQYAVKIFRKLGVSGRAQFMSLWLVGFSKAAEKSRSANQQ